METPKVVMMAVRGSAPRIGRIVKPFDGHPQDPTQENGREESNRKGPAPRDKKGQDEKTTDHAEIALGEIDDRCRIPDERKTKAIKP